MFLVNDLLDFTQIKNGKFRKNEGPTNIKLIVEQTAEIIRLAVEEKGLELRIFFC